MLWTIIIVLVIILDQATKFYVKNNLPLEQKNEVIKNFFYFTHVQNTGAAFGMLKNGRYFFIVLTVIVVGVLVYILVRNNRRFLRLAISFIIAGALGNWIDRVLTGSVTDFLDFYIFGYNYPVFNVADICINIGTFLLIIYLFFLNPEAIVKKAGGNSN
jgi:signal peptidase II